MKILFLLKERQYDKTYAHSYGLLNSANQVSKYLTKIGHECQISTVLDGNGIDKEVYNFKPDLVIIEALWCPTYKLKELIELERYKNIKWVVRIHSDIGFLGAETMAFTYINEYFELEKDNLSIALNNKKFCNQLNDIYGYCFEYLPNIIEKEHHRKHDNKHENQFLDVACFGALRILKNQIFQALCSIATAEYLDKKLRFHINYDEINDSNSSIYKNLVNLFETIPGHRHTLVCHNWMNHDKFLDKIERMDIGLQISYTESFNIVTADYITAGIPIIVSDAIDWTPWYTKASTTNYAKTIEKMILAYRFQNNKIFKYINRCYLEHFNNKSKYIWKKYLKG